jgi:hypothetical protein
MTQADKILTALLEADDEEDIKDLLGTGLGAPGSLGRGKIYRQDRWKDVVMGEEHFCVSYLTPVAYYVHDIHTADRDNVFISDNTWSSSTVRHIKKWLDHIGFDANEPWKEVQRRFPKRISQEELTDKFKQLAEQYSWGNREAKAFEPPHSKIRSGLKHSDAAVRIDQTREYQTPE